MKKALSALVVSAALAIAPASAAILSGTFTVEAVNVTNLNSSQSQATMANFNTYYDPMGATSDVFTYTGELDFGTFDGTDATTIADWLASGSGVVSGLDIGGLQLSKPNINNGTATTTFFKFTLDGGDLTQGDFTVIHDDGSAIFSDGTREGGLNGPTSQKTTNVAFDTGEFSLLYVATNGDPSVLNVDYDAVPVPAALPLFAGGLGLLGLARRRRKQAA